VGFVPFTAVDVYSWMREEGHLRFHKVAASTSKQSDDVLYADWSTPCIPCSSNGRTVSLKNTDRLQVPIAQCGSIVKLRPINLDSARRSSILSLVQHPTWKPSMSLDPSLTQYVVCVADPRRVIHLLDLPFFKTPSYRGSIGSSIRGGSVGSGSLCPIGHVSPTFHP